MLKRIFTLSLIVLLLVSALPFGAYATDYTGTNEECIYFEDGSYIRITITESVMRASGTKTGTKKYDYTGSDGEIKWEATLRGTFTYTGTSSVCTSSSCDVTIYESAFYVVSKTASTSGNAAIATLTMGRKVLGITVAKNTYNMSLSCDVNGNLS